MGVHDHEEVAQATAAQGDEPLLALGIWIFAGQGEVIFEHRSRFREAHAVLPQVRLGLGRIPLDPHEMIVWTFVLRVKPCPQRWRASPQAW